ncbi:hypothetical protein K7X08_008037 [Anisodus acutangulus]|uniref:Uncharacterized protein n=1 Tax=Anisodus acutangulus TaxID=402998 RepID=A0A9Q1RNZ2_9SOLA|nr:hypothetical protein K7X08_008037 [Anisodus acutangulus]
MVKGYSCIITSTPNLPPRVVCTVEVRVFKLQLFHTRGLHLVGLKSLLLMLRITSASSPKKADVFLAP